MIFTSCIPALDVLTIQLDSLSKPSRPHLIPVQIGIFSILNSCAGRNLIHPASSHDTEQSEAKAGILFILPPHNTEQSEAQTEIFSILHLLTILSKAKYNQDF